MSENAQNLILRYDYRIHLQEAQGANVKSIDAVMRAIAEFEAYFDETEFNRLTPNDVAAFKRQLNGRKLRQGDGTLSLSSKLHILHHLKGFFTWVRTREGYRRMDPDVLAFFSPSRRDETTTQSPPSRLGPSLETVEKVLALMPQGTPAERRNRAAIALILVTGVRDGALVSLRRKHLQFEQRQLIQDAREVSTKFGTNHVTWFFPISQVAEAIVGAWAIEIETLGFGPDDPLFPREVDLIRYRGRAGEVARAFLTSAASLRASLRAACASADVPYFFPHAIRNTIAVIGEERARTPLEFKAWSQNLGHKSVRTTHERYGTLRSDQVSDTLMAMVRRGKNSDVHDMFDAASPEKQAVVRQVLQLRR